MAQNVEKIDARLKKAQEKLETLYLRRDEIRNEIAAQEKLIAEIQADRKQAELGMLGFAAEAHGISIADLHHALETGSFDFLQQKMQESAQADSIGEPDESEAPDGSAAESDGVYVHEEE